MMILVSLAIILGLILLFLGVMGIPPEQELTDQDKNLYLKRLQKDNQKNDPLQ